MHTILPQAFNLAFKVPKCDPRTQFLNCFGANLVSGDCMYKTATGPNGFIALYTGFGVSVVGIVGYQDLQLGTFDTITGMNP